MLSTVKGWTSAEIAEVFRVREDTVRFWRGDVARGGVEAVKASVYAGPPPVKTEAARRVVTPRLETPVADRPNWTIPRPNSTTSRLSGTISKRIISPTTPLPTWPPSTGTFTRPWMR